MDDKEIELLEKDINIGNKYLYKLCAENDLSNIDFNINKDALSSQIWLIGRSYAASPQRRKGGNFTGPSGDSAFFDLLAEKLLSSKDFEVIREELNNFIPNRFRSNRYTFTKDSKDKEILFRAIELVLDYNRCLKQAMRKIDGGNANNNISFCSKFLHFHFPYTVFIMDAITKKNFVDDESATDISLKINKDETDLLINNILKELTDLSNEERPYVKHSCREYLLACELKELGLSLKTYYPRVVDTYMLKYRVVISK